jgi:thiamine-phosphate pyrophosphorylase
MLQQPPRLQPPLLYLITSGETIAQTTPATKDFANVLELVHAAVAAAIDLVQIREKNLSANVLYQLSVSAAAITRGSATKLLVNDRSDIAFAAGADGVHLTTRSLRADVVRRTFDDEFLIGVSTHLAAEASAAHRGGADFVVFGPVFDTASKREYGEPLGVAKLAQVASELSPFPVLALGGVEISNVTDCITAGAGGIAAIRMFSDPQRLGEVVKNIREMFTPDARHSSSLEYKL